MAPLVLTAAVVPGTKNLKRSDPVKRRLDYISSIYMWLTETKFDHLIIVEGSNTPIMTDQLKGLAKELGKTVEERLFDLNEVTRVFGKGRSEAIMLNAAANEIKGDFYKVTGRLFVTNTDEVLKSNGMWQRTHWNIKPATVEKNAVVDTRFFKSNSTWHKEAFEPLTVRILDSQPQFFIETVYVEEFIKVPEFYPRVKYFGANATIDNLA